MNSTETGRLLIIIPFVASVSINASSMNRTTFEKNLVICRRLTFEWLLLTRKTLVCSVSAIIHTWLLVMVNIVNGRLKCLNNHCPDKRTYHIQHI